MKKYIDACKTCNGNCHGCFYSEECDIWNDLGSEPFQLKVASASLALCEARHEMPVEGSIFGNSISDPTNVGRLEFEACKRLKGLDVEYLDLYVTGLTVALIAVLNVCKDLKIKVTLYHYNRETGDYYPQEVY